MSTRSQIGIYGNINSNLKGWNVLLYKHSDGYPENLEPLLMNYLKDPQTQRNLNDPEYLGAWLNHYMINEYIMEAKEYYEGRDEPILNIGHGICDQLHGDIEYYYAVYPDRLEIYEVPFIEPINFKNFNLIKTIKY